MDVDEGMSFLSLLERNGAAGLEIEKGIVRIPYVSEEDLGFVYGDRLRKLMETYSTPALSPA